MGRWTLNPTTATVVSGCTDTTATCKVTITDNTTVTANVEQLSYTVSGVALPSAGSTVALSQAAGPYRYNDSVTFTPSLTAGYALKATARWTLNPTTATVVSGCTDAASACQVRITGDTTVTANVEQLYTVTGSALPAAGATVSPAAGLYRYNDSVTLSVTALTAGYALKNVGRWTLDPTTATVVLGCTDTASVCQVRITGDTTVTANVERIYRVTGYPLATAGATVALSPVLATIGTSPVAGLYRYNDSVTLSVTALTAGYALKNVGRWTLNPTTATVVSGCTDASSACEVRITGDTIITANVEQLYTVTGSVAPTAGATVALSPTAGSYRYNDSVTFTPSLTAGYGLKATGRWTLNPTTATVVSGCTDAAVACQVTITGNITVTANVEQLYTVTGSALPAAGATVSPAAGLYRYNDSVTFTPTLTTTTARYALKNVGRWTLNPTTATILSGCTDMTTTCQIRITGNTTVIANVEQLYTVSGSASPAAGATVALSPAAASYRYNESVTFTPSLTAGYALKATGRWTLNPTTATILSGCTDVTTTCQVRITGNTTVTANVEALYKLSINATGPNTGEMISIFHASTLKTVNVGSPNLLLASQLTKDTTYSVSFVSWPSGYTCNPSESSGSMTGKIGSADVLITINCTATLYNLNVTATGLAAGTTVPVTYNGTTSNLATGSTIKLASLPSKPNPTPYSVALGSPPTGYTCTATANTAGTINLADVTISIACVRTYSLSITVTGLAAQGTLAATYLGTTFYLVNGVITSLAKNLVAYSEYQVTIGNPPTGYTCQPDVGSFGTNGQITGQIISSDVTRTINCTLRPPNISATPLSTPYTKGVGITNFFTENTGGEITACSTSPSLPGGLAFPAGLQIELFMGRCRVSGTPTTVTPGATYLIMASNAAGSSSWRVNLTVNDVVPIISFSDPYRILIKGTPITPIATTNTSIATTNTPIATTNTGGVITACSIAPALPTGLKIELNASACVISGTPSIVSPNTTYTITASNSGGSRTTDLALTVNEPPTYGLRADVAGLTTGTEVTVNYSSTSPTVTPVTSVRLGNSIGQTIKFGFLSQTPYSISVTSPVNQSCGVSPASGTFASADVTVQVKCANLTPNYNSVLRGGTLTYSVVGSTFGPVGYSVSPSSSGVSITSSGVMNVIPTATTGTYTITASAGGGTTGFPVQSLSGTLTVIEPLTITRNSSASLIPGKPDRITQFTAGGGQSSLGYVFSIAPNPTTFSLLFVSGNSSVINLSALGTAAAGTYTLTLTNGSGSTLQTQTASVTVTVAPPTITYANGISTMVTTNSYTINPTLTGTPLQSCTAFPALPAGLSINTATCVISGTPSTPQSQVTYTITATNPGGTGRTYVYIAVNATCGANSTWNGTSCACNSGYSLVNGSCQAPCPSYNAYASQQLVCGPNPASCGGTIWGTGVYTNDSHPCKAARHCGAIGINGGSISTTYLGSRPSFIGTTSNGITSSSYTAYNAYQISGCNAATSPTPTPTPAPTVYASCPTTRCVASTRLPYHQPGCTYTGNHPHGGRLYKIVHNYGGTGFFYASDLVELSNARTVAPASAAFTVTCNNGTFY